MAGIDQLLYGYDPSSQPLFQQDQPQPKSLLERILTETWPAKMAQAAYNAVTLPGDVYAGRVPVTDSSGRTSTDVINRSADLAALMQMGSMAAPAQDNAVGMGIRAYHGSPYDFEKFDLSKIGTGEGAQAYGHGLYFAENPATAQIYRDALATNISVDGKPILSSNRVLGTTGDIGIDDMLIAHNGNLDAAISDLRNHLLELNPAQIARGGYTGQLAKMEALRGRVQSSTGGKMYEVNINADPQQFLDWDKPLSQQPQQVRDVLSNAGDIGTRKAYLAGPGEPSGGNVYMALAPRRAQTINSRLGPYTVYPQDEAAAASTLRDAGIPGIKYLDQGSRAAGDGSRNYVVFDPSIIDILRKYGLAGLTAGGLGAASAMTPDQAQAQQ